MPDSSAPAVRSAITVARSSSEETAGCRISTISWSPISLRAHWITPTPMNSRASPRVPPSARVDAPRPAAVSWLSPMSMVK